jgi:hypothetical protein
MRGENVFEATMNAVIIYDDFAFAAKAWAILKKAAHRADEGTQWNVKPWRLDMLNFPPAADAALAEATGAHLIVFALRAAGFVPAWLVDWLEKWSARREVPEAALAVWEGGSAEALPARATGELSRFADRHHLRFIFDDGKPVADESAMCALDLHGREVALTPTLQCILNEPVAGY